MIKYGNGYKIVTSPNEDVSKEYILSFVAEPSAKIKEIIVKDIANNVDKELTEKAIKQVIRESLKDCPTTYKGEVKQALKVMAKRDYYVLSNNARVLQRKFEREMKDATGESFKVNIFNIGNEIDIRGKNTDAAKGLPIIKDYQDKLREQLKMISLMPPIIAKDGRRVSARNLVEMSVRYDANQKDLKELEESGTDLVWLSSHADCSKRCEPYQGKLYSISGKNSGKIIDGNQVEKISLNEVMALNSGNSIINGYNCRHYVIEYSKGTKAPKEYNEQTIKRERYIDQKQRAYENSIRQLKMQEKVANASGDKALAEKLSNQWHKKMKKYEDYSLSNGRAYYPWRTQIMREEKK